MSFLAPPCLEELETLALARDPHPQKSVLHEGLGDARRCSVSSDDGSDAPVSEKERRGKVSCRARGGRQTEAGNGHEEAERSGRREHVLGHGMQGSLRSRSSPDEVSVAV